MNCDQVEPATPPPTASSASSAGRRWLLLRGLVVGKKLARTKKGVRSERVVAEWRFWSHASWQIHLRLPATRASERRWTNHARRATTAWLWALVAQTGRTQRLAAIEVAGIVTPPGVWLKRNSRRHTFLPPIHSSSQTFIHSVYRSSCPSVWLSNFCHPYRRRLHNSDRRAAGLRRPFHVVIRLSAPGSCPSICSSPV